MLSKLLQDHGVKVFLLFRTSGEHQALTASSGHQAEVPDFDLPHSKGDGPKPSERQRLVMHAPKPCPRDGHTHMAS